MSLTPQDITSRIEAVEELGTSNLEDAVTELIALYREASSGAGAYEDTKKSIRAMLNDIIAETGHEVFITPAGTAKLTSPGSRVSYETKRLERLLADWAQRAPDFASELARCRVESEVPGTLRITG